MGLNLTTQFISSSFKGLLQVSGSDQVTDGTGSLITNLNIQASTAVSSSFATTATSASHALNANNSISSSYSVSATSSSYANTSTSASHALSADTSISSSYALTASYAENANVDSGSWDGQYSGSNVNITAPLSTFNGDVRINGVAGNQYALYVNPEEGSLSGIQTQVRGTGSNGYPIAYQANYVSGGLYNVGLAMQFDATDPNNVKPTWYMDSNGNGARIVSEDLFDIDILNGDPLTINAPVILAQNATGSLFGTASFADNATSASYAVTASYALNAGGGAGFPFTGSAGISGSLRVHNNNGLDAQFKEDGDIVLQTGGDIDFNLVNGDINSVVSVRKGISSYTLGINQFPGFTGSIISVDNVDEFKVTGDVPLAFDNTGYGGTNPVSLRASGDVNLISADDITGTATDTITFTANTSQSNQGLELNARNVRINLTETGSGYGTFAMAAPGFAPNRPGLSLTLNTGSYGSNPTISSMLFTGEDSFFSAVGSFYIKNVYNDTGSLSVWSENKLTLRGDTSITIQGDTFGNPNDPIDIDINGTTFMHSLTSGIMAFEPQIGTYTRVSQYKRAFVETPLVINGGGTIEVQTGATLKVINEL